MNGAVNGTEAASDAVATALLGPILIGDSVNLLLFGVLISTFSSYLSANGWSRATRGTKSAILAVVVLDTFSVANSFHDIWFFGTLQDRSQPSILTGTPMETIQPLIVGLTGFIVQIVLTFRTAKYFKSSTLKMLYIVFLIIVESVSFLGSIGATASLIAQFSSIAAQSAAYTTLVALPGAIVCAVFSPNSIMTTDIAFAFFLPLPTLYALSLLTTLHAPHRVRELRRISKEAKPTPATIHFAVAVDSRPERGVVVEVEQWEGEEDEEGYACTTQTGSPRSFDKDEESHVQVRR